MHGFAVISETPAHLLGQTLREGSCSRTFGTKPFHVELVATRNGKAFGALPRVTAHDDRDAALEHARRALVQQGKRYAKKHAAGTL